MYFVLALARAGQLDPVQRRDGGEHPARVEHRPHVAVEQGEQQAADVRAVDVGVGHQDHPLVAGRVEVEGAARAGPDDLDDRGALGVLEHVGERRLLHVEDLAADRQQRLELGVAGQLGGAERGVALDDEQLAAVVGATGSRPAWPGRAELARADLRRWFSRCSRAAIRVLAAATTFSSTRPGLLLAPRLPRVSKNSFSSAADDLLARSGSRPGCRAPPWSGPRTAARAAGRRPPRSGPRARRPWSPASSPFLSSRAARSCSFSVRTRARSKPVTWVPPLGVAMTLTNERVTVS